MNGSRVGLGALLAVGLLLGPAAIAQSSNPQDQSSPQTASPSYGAQQSTQPQNTTGQDNSASNQEPVTLVDPGKIYNQDPTNWVGKRVTLQNVMVQDADKAGNFWVGSDKGHRLLIVKSKSDPNLAAKEFHKGDIVTITGTIHPAGEAEAQETDASNGKMKKARNTSGVFLLADDVDIASSTQHK